MLPSNTVTGLTENLKDGTVSCKHRDLSCCEDCFTKHRDTIFFDHGATYALRDCLGAVMFVDETILEEFDHMMEQKV